MDRNNPETGENPVFGVALRKESVDRNAVRAEIEVGFRVALRKESVDRNNIVSASFRACTTSLSARRAWIEILFGSC